MRKTEAERRGLAELPREFLIVGEGGVYLQPCRLDTLLGSCVAVTFHCPVRKAGGIFHALLPVKSNYSRPGCVESEYRFVDSAINSICSDFLAMGVQPRRLEAKVFGGSNALSEQEGIGRANVEAAYVALKSHGIRVLFTSAGGKQGRRIIFLPHTGEVYMKLLGVSEACPIQERRSGQRS
ncbi:MAG: chemotaxis protein CheD [Proteobacteria bacterium]|nr:chemotaxis protein CheD [Pseudomonadota bacterium]MBU1610583.1 chemotaxis protein CheD [Pseudomonadota bacterium]